MSPDGPLTDAGLVQLLTPAGERVEHPVYSPLVAHLDGDALRAMYRDMVLVRRFDNEATSLQRQGELVRSGFGGLAHAHQVAGIDGAEIVLTEDGGRCLRLTQAHAAQGDVGLALHASFGIPFGFAMADQA